MLDFLKNLWGLEPSRNRVVVLPCQATLAGGIDSLESILGLLKSLKIQAMSIRTWALFQIGLENCTKEPETENVTHQKDFLWMSSFYVNKLFLPLLLSAYGMGDGGVLVEFSFDVPRRYSSGLDWRPGLFGNIAHIKWQIKHTYCTYDWQMLLCKPYAYISYAGVSDLPIRISKILKILIKTQDFFLLLKAIIRAAVGFLIFRRLLWFLNYK